MCHKRKLIVDNNELIKAVDETFSITIWFAFSLIYIYIYIYTLYIYIYIYMQ